MGSKRHCYRTTTCWTGNVGAGTSTYGGYQRSHTLTCTGKPPIRASSDPEFRGDAACWNPEELLVAALSSCHQLSYLALCARSGVSVLSYEDEAEGIMEENGPGGRFTSVVLKPRVIVASDSEIAKAKALHHDAHEQCYLASSMNFAVECQPFVEVDDKRRT